MSKSERWPVAACLILGTALLFPLAGDASGSCPVPSGTCDVANVGDLLASCHSTVCNLGFTTMRLQIGGPNSRSSEGCSNPALLGDGFPAASIVDFTFDGITAAAGDPSLPDLRIRLRNSSCTSTITAIYFNAGPNVASLANLSVSGAITTWNLAFEEATSVMGTGFGADGFGRFDAVIYNGDNPSPQGGNPFELTAGGELVFTVDVIAAGGAPVSVCDFNSELSITPPGSIENRRNIVGRYQAGPQGGSAFIGPCSPPLLVELESFDVTPLDGAVKVAWATRSEIENQGFNVIREEALRRGSQNVNVSLIPGRGDSLTGVRYEFTDATAVNGVAYRYYLEDIDFADLNTINGPRVAIANPQNPRVRLLAPDYGQEISDVRLLRFSLDTAERGRLTLQVSADPTFRTRTLNVYVGSSRTSVILGASESRQIAEMAAGAEGHLYWRVRTSSASTAGSDSQTYRFRILSSGSR